MSARDLSHLLPRDFASLEELAAWAETHRAELGGTALHALFLHDAECSATRCVCTPSVRVEVLTLENVREGARLTREWRRNTAS